MIMFLRKFPWIWSIKNEKKSQKSKNENVRFSIDFGSSCGELIFFIKIKFEKTFF